jgi:hypothetical protein
MINHIKQRMENAKTVAGSRSHHKFVPVGEHDLRMYHLSTDDTSTLITATVPMQESHHVPIVAADLSPGKYVCVIYDDVWYIAIVEDVSHLHEDANVRFMYRVESTNTLYWPQREDNCNIPFVDVHVLCCVPTPELLHSGGRQYKLNESTIMQITELYQNYIIRNA